MNKWNICRGRGARLKNEETYRGLAQKVIGIKSATYSGNDLKAFLFTQCPFGTPMLQLLYKQEVNKL